jgi:hypothetical protein
LIGEYIGELLLEKDYKKRTTIATSGYAVGVGKKHVSYL